LGSSYIIIKFVDPHLKELFLEVFIETVVIKFIFVVSPLRFESQTSRLRASCSDWLSL